MERGIDDNRASEDVFDSIFSEDLAKAGEEGLNHKKESKSPTDSTGIICSAAKKVKHGSNDNGNPCEGRCWRRCFNHYKPNQLHFKIYKMPALYYSFSGKQKSFLKCESDALKRDYFSLFSYRFHTTRPRHHRTC